MMKADQEMSPMAIIREPLIGLWWFAEPAEEEDEEAEGW